MKNKLFFIIGLLLTIFGAVLGYFAQLPVVEITGLASASLGLALLIVSVVQKAEKKDWKLYTSIVGVVLGAFILGLMGVTEDKVKAVITGVVGLIVIIVSIIPAMFVVKKKDEAKVGSKNTV